MIFEPTKIESAWILDMDRKEDHRGFFARSFCVNEFREYGLNARIAQINIGLSSKKGSVRGLHYQLAPHEEIKIVRCTQGAIFDVALDLRIGSPTSKQWVGCELSAENRRILVVPKGCAHGYQTLQDNTEVEYLTTAVYAPHACRGVRYDDPLFNIAWPIPVTVVSEADRSWPDFQESIVEVLPTRSGNDHR